MAKRILLATAQAVLLAAATKLEKTGWCRRDDQREFPDGVHFCAAGVIDSIPVKTDFVRQEALRRLAKDVMPTANLDHPYDVIVIWNDAEGRRRRQVVTAMRRAAR